MNDQVWVALISGVAGILSGFIALMMARRGEGAKQLVAKHEQEITATERQLAAWRDLNEELRGELDRERRRMQDLEKENDELRKERRELMRRVDDLEGGRT